MPNKEQSIEELQTRYQRFKDQKIRIETQREQALAQLEELKGQAREQFETDDVEKLKTLLDEMKRSNEEKRSKYQASLDAIDGELGAIQSKFGETDAKTGEPTKA